MSEVRKASSGISTGDAERLARDLYYARCSIEVVDCLRYEKLRNLLLYASQELTSLQESAKQRGDSVI